MALPVMAGVITVAYGLGYPLGVTQHTFNAAMMMATAASIMAMIMPLFAVLGRVEVRLVR